MDTKIKNGAWVCDSAGLLQTVNCFEELLQRAFIRLSVPLGSLVYQPSFGSRLSLVWNEEAVLRSQRAVQLAQEALVSMPELNVLSAQADENEGRIIFKISSGENTGEVEVTVGKNI